MIINKEMINAYVYNYGGVKEFGLGADRLIQNSAEAKDVRLNKLFGGELILEKEIIVEKPIAELEDAMLDEMADLSFRKHFRRLIMDSLEREIIGFEGKEFNGETKLSKMCYAFILVEGVMRDSFVLKNLETGKKIKISEGQKIMKAFGSILKLLNVGEDLLEEFEQFRLAHSRVLNDKMTKGTLCLSIHPMDYMTLSDNANNWSSCMSWAGEGCFRAGTLELMNCENTIVAYLKSSKEELNFIGRDGSLHNWNSKKWRQLIHITDEAIVSNKPYPYFNEPVTKYALAWLKELSEERLGLKYENKLYEYSEEEEGEGRLIVNAETNLMYNDIASNDACELFYAIEGLCDRENYIHLHIGGTAHCLQCGDIHFYEEGILLCNNCYEDSDSMYCEACGTTHSDEEYYIENEEIYVCETCYHDSYGRCDECGKDYSQDELTNAEFSSKKGHYERDGLFCPDCLNKIPEILERKEKAHLEEKEADRIIKETLLGIEPVVLETVVFEED